MKYYLLEYWPSSAGGAQKYENIFLMNEVGQVLFTAPNEDKLLFLLPYQMINPADVTINTPDQILAFAQQKLIGGHNIRAHTHKPSLEERLT